MNAIISVIGKDRVGIIAEVSGYLSNQNVNINDISQTILQDYFTMMMLVNLTDSSITVKELREGLNKIGEELGVTVSMHHEDVLKAMHRI